MLDAATRVSPAEGSVGLKLVGGDRSVDTPRERNRRKQTEAQADNVESWGSHARRSSTFRATLPNALDHSVTAGSLRRKTSKRSSMTQIATNTNIQTRTLCCGSMLWSLRRAVALFLFGFLLACKSSEAAPAVQDCDESEVLEETPEPELADRAFPLLAWAVHLVKTEYFDQSRFDAQAQLRSALDTVGLHTPEFFAEIGEDGAVSLRVRSASQTFQSADVKTLDDAARLLESMLVFAQTELKLEPEDLHAVEYAAINGLLAPLDPHTILLTPEEHADLGERTRGSFGGIGAEIRVEGRTLLVVRVLPGMPAEKAGMKGGDVLLRIGDRSTVSMSVSEAQKLLRGPVGTTVKVKARRKKKSVDLTIERAVIRLDSVSATTLPGGIEYVRISQFQEDTAAKLKEALVARGDSLRGVVLDLRGNGGGLLVQATEIVDLFVPRGELVIVRSAYGREVDEAEAATTVSGDTPVVVLVDEEAASAAEIVSGGLQALGRAVVLGRTSFGKGSVQVVRPAAPYGRELALKLTIAEYLVAGDRRIQARGVVPDLELLPVEPTLFDHVVRYYDEERFERARERARMAHHPSAKHEAFDVDAQRSPSRLRYLATLELPTSLEGVEVPEVMHDPEVRIAASVVSAVPTRLDIEGRRSAVAGVQTKLQEEEAPRIAAALAKADVVWGPEGAHDTALSATARILTPLPIEAGETFELEVSVTNRSDEVAHRVHAITDCERERLDGIELLFGDIGAGQTQTRTVELHVMSWYADFVGDLDVQVHVGEPDSEPDAESRAIFETQAQPRPALSYDVWLVDDPALVAKAPKRPPSEPVPGLPEFSVQGNGDGMLQPGERVLLAFRAYNHGDGDSPDVRAFVRNLSGEQGLLEEGFMALGPLPVGKEVSGAFGIWIKDDADPGRPFLLDLTVGDAQLRVAASDTMTLSVLPASGERSDAASTASVTGTPLMLRAGAHASAPVAADVAPGTTLSFEGKVGPWLYVTAPQEPSRRWFVAEDQGGFGDAKGTTKPAAGMVARRSVRPPSLDLQPIPRRTTAAAITLEGVASHPRHLRDVVVMVRPPGPGQVDRKIEYAAAGPDGKTLAFDAEIPLEPGGNRVFVLARSDGDVQVSRELWVYRGS
jgi:carboxyl-terminal processing protease